MNFYSKKEGLFFLFLSLSTFAGILEKEVTFKKDEISFTKIEQYDFIRLKGCESNVEVGAPSLPRASFSLLIPQGSEVANVEVVSFDREIISGEYAVYPTQHPQPFIKGKVFPFVEPNKDIYAQDTPYPEKIIEYSHTGSMGGFRLASVLIYPVQYVPNEKKLIFYSKIKFKVTYKENLRSLNTKTEKQKTIFEERVKKLILNPEDIEISKPTVGLSGSRALPADNVEYVIITAPSLKEPFQELADWKTKKGVPAKVVTLDSIYVNYSGVDNADRVRNFIIDANSSWGTIWVLLGGQCDYEWGQEIVPRRNVWYMSTYSGEYPDEDTIPSDLYFSDLDGNWNADGDGVFGESTDNVDFYSDVFVGRAPVRTLAQAEIFVNKVLAYEKNPPSGYQKKILLPAAYLWPSLYDERTSQEAIANIIPSDWQVTKMYERDGNLVHSTFVDSVRAGFGFAHLVGHGNEYGVYTYYEDAYINSDDMDALGNGDLLGIHNSLACMAGGLDLVPNGDCFAEHYLTPSTGGSFSIMNSRYGWGQPPNMGPSEHIDTCFYHEIFKENYLYHDRLGVAHAFSKDGYIPRITWSSVWPWCIYELNLFGDPELPLRTDIPKELTVSHDPVIPVGASTFNVNVSDDGFGVEEALVCLYKEGEVYETEYTDASGNITFTLSSPPNSLGTMYCTVTKTNYLPYEGNVDVISPSGPWVIYDSCTTLDISGNNDDNVDPGENIELWLTVHNVGLDSAYSITGILRTNDSYVIITDSTEEFGDIPPDSFSGSLEAFDFDVALECPANHIITFKLVVKDINDSTWVSSFSVPISTPDITVSADTLNFDTVFVAYADTLELLVNNIGRDTLFISNITSDNIDYSIDIANFNLPPNESQPVRVIFAPNSEGSSTGNLTIESNDLDEPSLTVFLKGEGLEPPDISVSPDSVSDSLFTGETSTHTLTIYNTGESELNFDISLKELLSTTKAPNISFKVTEFKNNKIAISDENSGTINKPGATFSKRIYKSSAPTLNLENILVMESGPGSYHYDTALANLGLSRTLVTYWDALHTELNSETRWNLVIVNSYSNIPSNEILDALDDYQEQGGLLIYTDWALYNYSSHSLLTSLGIGFVSDLTTPLNFYAVNNGHALFNNPNDIDSLFWTDNQYHRDVEIVNVLTGATQLAYLEGYPDNGAIVLNAKRNCLFNAFQAMNFNADDDGDGRLDIVELIENEIVFLSTRWLSVEPFSGTIPSADSILVEITFDATNLYGGDYFTDIIITSNDPDEPKVTVPAHLHVTGVPDISVSKDTLDYGIVFTGYSATDTLIIENVGTDLLTVNDISSDNPDFTVDVTDFTVSPGKTRSIVVTFTPGSLGMVTGTLTIYCDDPDEPTIDIALQGECLEPPDISVSPDSLRDSLFTGETSTHTLTIYNTGLSDLIFYILIEEEGEMESLVSFNTRITLGDKKISNTESQKSISGETASANLSNNPVQLYESSKTRGIQNIAILGPDGSDSNSYLNDIAQHLINSGHFSSVTTINAYLVTPTVAELKKFDAVGAFGWYGWNDAVAVGNILADYVDEGGNLFIAFAANGTGGGWKIEGRFDTENYWLISPYSYYGGTSYHMGNVYEPEHPIMDGVSTLISRSKLNSGASVSPGATLLAEFLDGTPLAVVNKVGYSRRVDISFPFFTSAVSNWGIDTTSDAELFIINAFEWVMGPDWLSGNPTSDTVPPGDSVKIEMTFDATGLYGGDYFSNVVVVSNDPDEPRTMVPAHLYVTGAPDIAVSEDTLDFGIVFTGSSATDTLIISNEGTAALTISDIATDYYNFIIDTTNFTLNPRESQEIPITFTPISLGTIIRVLRIYCDDPDDSTVTLFLRGECLEPPDISVSPDSLNDTLTENEISKHILSIYNTGASDLNFNITIEESDSFGVKSATNSKQPTVLSSSVIRGSLILSPEETAEYIPSDLPGIAPRQFASPIIFKDNFEDGNYDGWSSGGGSGIKEVTNSTAAKGTIYSFHEYNSPDGTHFSGIYQQLGSVQPGYISFYIRSGSTAMHDAYFTLQNSTGYVAIWFFARGSGYLYVNEDVGGDETYAYTAETWYHIEFKNIDFTSKTFDYYVNKNLVKASIPFRNAQYIENFDRLDIYNFSGGSQAWWDEISILTGEFPAWVVVDSLSGTVSSGDSVNMEVTFDATDLDVGDYFADIIIESNVPDKLQVIVPAHLQVLSSGIEEKPIPKVFSIFQNYPNPFNRQTTIRYGCPKNSKVEIQIFDITGRYIATLVNKEVEAGYYEVIWNGCTDSGTKAVAGIYFYKMKTSDFIATKKMVLLR